MLRIAVCHKNQQFVKVIRSLVSMQTLYGRSFVFAYPDVNVMLKDFSENRSVDMLIIDAEQVIRHEEDILKLFCNRMPNCVFVLTARDGMVDADLLKIKPYRCLYERDISVKNIKAMHDAVAYAYLHKKKIFIWGSFDKVSYKISPEDILYVSIAKHGSLLHLHPECEAGKIANEMKSSEKLSELFDTVGQCGFAYAHNSYLINLEYVEKYSGSQIQLSDGSILSVSRSKEKGFDDALHEYWDAHFSQ